MKELIKITEHDGKKAVSARELHRYVVQDAKGGQKGEQFNHWIARMLEYGFIDGTDYVIIEYDYRGVEISQSDNQRVAKRDYVLSIDCAKEVSMLQRNDKGKEARQYFIEMEKVALSKSFDPDSLSRKDIAKMLWEAEEERERLEAQNRIQAKELKAAAPKVYYYEKVIQSDQAIRTTVIAKDLGMSAGRLNMLLHRMGIQYKVKDTWVLYSDYQGKGYTKSVTHHFTGSDGNAKTSILTCWTQKGREFIMEAVPKYLENIQSRKLMKVN